MFTGLIQELGMVESITPLPEAMRLTIVAPTTVENTRKGDSISVNGVCLTVVEKTDTGHFTADVMLESLERSSLKTLQEKHLVNIEKAVCASDALGGHIVQGHVDGIAYVDTIQPSQFWTVMSFAIDQRLAPYIVEKGSITVNGVSLTVTSVLDQLNGEPNQSHQGDTAKSQASAPTKCHFSVSLIPETLKNTVLGTLKIGQMVNIEVDVLAKYVERMLHYKYTNEIK